MWVKRLFAFCATSSVILMVGWPVLIGTPPKGGTKAEMARYALKAEIYFPLVMVFLLATVIFAYLVGRRAREQYLTESAENLKTLIEGTLEDHRKHETDG